MDNDTPKRVGRPKKTAVAAKKKGNRKAIGRPKGDAAIINEYKARMLASPKSRKVLDKVFEAALDDEHKHQAAAWKMVLDRVAPLSAFEQDVKKSGGSNGINIKISVAGQATKIDGREVGDLGEGDWEEVPDE